MKETAPGVDNQSVYRKREGMRGRDLRGWIEEAERLGELQRVEGADWDVELGNHRGKNSQAWPDPV
jgi:hypothetical protein